jgi:hypothetical protein
MNKNTCFFKIINRSSTKGRSIFHLNAMSSIKSLVLVSLHMLDKAQNSFFSLTHNTALCPT